MNIAHLPTWTDSQIALPPTPTVAPTPATGSRRRRIWELAHHAQCPVIGVCLPIAQVRRLVDKVLGGSAQASDYELHCGVNTECKQRNPLSEAVNKALDQRFERTVRELRRLKTTAELAQWWQETSHRGADVPGALWATLTHPRCDTELEETVLQDIHMLQHQNGAADRADWAKLQALQHENQVLSRELAAAQQRSSRQAEGFAQKIDHQQAQLMRVRAELIGRDTVIAALWEQLRDLEASVPGLRSRKEQAQQLAWQSQRIQSLERMLTELRSQAQQAEQRADLAEQALAAAVLASTVPLPPKPAEVDPGDKVSELSNRAVLCVGGRASSVPAYRQLIEQEGGRFLHHDGGEEDSSARLDQTLDSADVVICQTGCISHGAYWRVKDHCKRTGKPCVFVDNPSSSSLRRALIHIQVK